MNTQFHVGHYHILAVTMRESAPPVKEMDARRQHWADCKAIAKMLASDNPWFNTNLFMYKCGYQMEGMVP